MNPNKALWEKGDFTRIAASMRESGEALVASLGVAPGMDVLDLGCGDGTTAVPAAQLGANVLGVDIASNLVAAGNARAQELGLDNLTFQEGDATDLGDLDDDSFDLVVSVFGAMFAPRLEAVAREVVRVARPGGRVVMGNWIPGDPTLVAQILKISSAYSPPPPEGFVSPMTWGIEANVVERMRDVGLLDYSRLTGMMLQAWSPFQKGFFGGVFIGDLENYAELNTVLDTLAKRHGVTPTGIAVAWITRHPANIQVVLGTTKPERVRRSAAGSDVRLTREEWYQLFRAAGHTLP